MSRQPRTVLVLGGIRSGKSAFAESLVSDAAHVRYVATAATDDGDAEWAARIAAHRDRRPDHWTTEEIGGAPDELTKLITDAGADDTVLVDDIGGWLSALLHRAAGADADGESPAANAGEVAGAVESLALAVTVTPARVIFVSPEVGLSLVPTTALGRVFADASGSVNRALAEACDAVALVVAGQPTWIKATAGRTPANEVIAAPVAGRTRTAAVATDFGGVLPEGDNPITLGMALPLPDTTASTAATTRAERLPLPGAGLGALTEAIAFAAGVQATEVPEPFRSVRVIVVHGAHRGDVSVGESPETWSDRLDATRDGTSPLARLAGEAGAAVEIIDTGEAAPIEDGDAATDDEIDLALRRGWAAANAAADRGDDLIVLAASGPGVEAAAAATVATVTTSEVPGVLGRVFGPDGRIDDDAWMRRCVVVRDARLRVRGVSGFATDARTALGAVGGPTLATATGVLLGAAARKTPVLLDGPVGTAAALLARDYAAQTRMWCLLTDIGNQPTVRTAADLLGLTPLVDLGLGLGEGCNALAVLPLIQTALALSAALGPVTAAPEDAATPEDGSTDTSTT